ncbi:pyrrolo-quinoline quinone [Croceicoccus ponticola]|uniref:Pyrrolo-quinoline quinone n=1 Tax=Croceicoccus ponticola TaxID=2217664 RepID=A0A437GU54_9SPHN|nr:PQQ-binding-like beta-propeller repeat protein [Croceicoccus ponticola]RVQ64843.1 pyrrolo-quinoline quinone [Croceicoccus ponticola]
MARNTPLGRRAIILAGTTFAAALTLAAGGGLNAAPAEKAPEPSFINGELAAAEHYRDASSISDEVRALGEEVWSGNCAACHDNGVARAPIPYIVRQLTPEAIYKALTEGVMVPMAQALEDKEKRAVAEYLAGRSMGTSTAVPVEACTGEAAVFDRKQTVAYPYWGVDAGQTHYIPADMAGIDAANVGDLELKWAMAFPNATRARSQPAFAGGAVIVGGQDNLVRALDEKTGCQVWAFETSAEVRTGIVVESWNTADADARPLAFFGDVSGNAYAIEAMTGKLVWRFSADDHGSTTLTGTPTLHDGVVYVPVSSLEEGAAGTPGYPCCTFRGSVIAVDAKTGALKWRTYLVPESKPVDKSLTGKTLYGPSGVPVWSAITVDDKRGMLYVATGDNYTGPATELSDALVALNKETGEIAWHFQALAGDAWNAACEEKVQANCPEEDGPDFDFGVNPVLAKTKAGKDMILLGQKSSIAYGVDPDTRQLVWKKQVGRGGVVGGIHFGMAAHDGVLYVPVSDVPDGNKYDIPPNPGMFALDIATGEYVWQAPSKDVCEGKSMCHPGYSAAISMTPDLVFAGSNDGHVRAYHAKDGTVAWDIDTAIEYTAANGVKGRGGSMSGGAAPMPHNGMLFVNSGYGFAGKMPGNVFLAYGPKDD